MVDFPILAFVIIPGAMVVAVFIAQHIDNINNKNKKS